MSISNLFMHSAIMILLFCFSSCEQTSDHGTDKINITVLSVNSTEAVLKISVPSDVLNKEIALNINDSLSFCKVPDSATFIYRVSSLVPNNYYKASAYYKSYDMIYSSDAISFSTLNLTSNNYEWHKYTFGNGATSQLRDVIITEDDSVWGLGYINYRDSTTNGDTYNVVKWKSNQIKKEKIYFSFLGNQDLYPINVVKYFDKNNYWVAFAKIFHWNGSILKYVDITNGFNLKVVNKIYGSSPQNFYLLGEDGYLVHYDGYNFTKINTGITADLLDMSTFFNPYTQKEESIILAGYPYQNIPGKLYRLQDNSVSEINSIGLSTELISLLVLPGYQYFLTGAGLYTNKQLNNLWEKLPNSIYNSNYTYGIAGDKPNDIFVCGNAGLVMHYNGQSWHIFPEAAIAYGIYTKIVKKGNLVAAVGWENQSAVLLVGKLIN